MTEQLKFENAGSLSSSELKELQKFKESQLECLDEKSLKNLKQSLLAEKDGYNHRSKNEKSKERIDGMIKTVIKAIEKKLSELKKSESNKRTTKEKINSEKSNKSDKNHNSVKEPDKNNVKDSKSIDTSTETNKNHEKEQKTLTALKAEHEFDQRLDTVLNSETTTVLTVGNQVLVMQFDNVKQKIEADSVFLNLEKGFSDGKMAAYAMKEFLVKYKDNIKSISDIYKEAGKGLYGNQIVFAEDDTQKQKALLDAAEKKDVEVIDVDTGSVWGNVFIKTFTLGLGGDTANVSEEKMTYGAYGEKMSSTRLFEGYHIGDSFDGTWLQKPLGHFERSEVISDIADKIADLLLKANDGELKEKDKKTPEYKIALAYKKYLTKQITSNNSLSTEISKKDLQDDAIKKWLESPDGKKTFDNFITKDPVIEITKDGFMKINPDEAIGDKKYVKVQLDGVKNGDTEKNETILMKANKLNYSELGFNQAIDKQLASMPPIVLEDGTMFAFGKEGMYVLGKDIGNGADAVKDYIARHQVVSAAIAGGIIGALLAKGGLPKLHLNLSRLGEGLEKLAHNIGHLTKQAGTDVKDLFKNIDLSSLNNLFGGYLLTAIPMNYQIECLERELAETKGKYEGSNSIKAEIDAVMDNDKIYTDMLKDKMLFNQTEELQNEYAHFILVKNGFAKAGELTALDFSANVDKNGDITITAQGNDDNKMLVEGKELYIPDGKELQIKLLKNGNVDSINGQINIPVFGKDNYMKFGGNGTIGNYYIGHNIGHDKESKSDITINSIDDIVKYTNSSKKETKEMEDGSYNAKLLESIIDSGIDPSLQKYLDGDGSSHTKGFVDNVRYDGPGNLLFDLNIQGSWSDLSVKVKSKHGENPSEADIINAVNDKLKKHFLGANE